MEMHELQALPNGANDKDIQKVSKFFAQASGAQAACKRLLKKYTQDVPVGTVIRQLTVEWTLCKHLLLADRQGQTNGVVLQPSPTCIPCNCLAKTYFMPRGCNHLKKAIFQDTFLPSTLCAACSICLRCEKFPGL